MVAVLVVGMISCATAPKTASERQELEMRAAQTLQEMRQRDPSLDQVLPTAAGYVVFPSIGKGGAIVGAAYGRGILYEQGQPAGYVELNQASLGAQLGGQTLSELIVFRDRADIERLRQGKFSVGANVSAVALTSGAAATASLTEDVSVFVLPRGGAMAEVSVSGQQLNYQPLSG